MTRQQRRQEERRLKKSKITGTSQVFSFTDESGDSKHLDVEAMRRWAESNMVMEQADIDLVKIEDMLKNKRLDVGYLQQAIEKEPKPVLICLDFKLGMSEIVDGNHSYAAVGMFALKAQEMGMPVPQPLRVAAYCFKRPDWQMFLL